MVTTKPLRVDQPVHVMISPEAFLRVLSLVPVGEVGLFGSPEATFMQLHENAQRLAREGVMSRAQAANSSVPLMVWDVHEEKGTQELYPVLVFSQTLKRITDDVYSDGTMFLTAHGGIELDKTSLHAKGQIKLQSDQSITQIGGRISSGEAVVMQAPEIVHEMCKEVFESVEHQGKTTIARRMEKVTAVPVVQAPVVKQTGNVTATGVQIQAETFNHSGGTLTLKPAMTTATTDTAFYQGRKSVVSHSVQEQVAIPSTIQARVAHFHGDTTLTGVMAQLDRVYKYAGLTLAAQVTTNSSTGTATNNGFFRTTRVTTSSTHQEALPTVLNGEVLKDMNAQGGPLVMRSSILNMVDQELVTDLIQETTYLQQTTTRTTETSGWSFATGARFTLVKRKVSPAFMLRIQFS